MSTKYTVTIIGLDSDSSSEIEIRANLVRLLKQPAEKIDRLLDRLPRVIKKNIERELADKYDKALTQAGVLVEIKPEEMELGLEPAREHKPETTQQFTCPQCSTAVEKFGKCPGCLAKEIKAQPQGAPVDKLAKHREKIDVIKQSAITLLIQWIKGNAWKAGIVFILIPFFGSKLLITTIFYTQDQHLVYETVSERTVCVKDPTNVLKMHSNQDQDMYSLFYEDFNEKEKEEVLKKWGNVACRAIYEMELGNIGEEPVTTRIRFATRHFVKGVKTRDTRVLPKFANLSATEPREQDPIVEQDEGKIMLKDIYPGTLVNLKFGGWIDGKGTAVDWETMLIEIDIDEGVVEVGDPQATALGRLLTVFF